MDSLGDDSLVYCREQSILANRPRLIPGHEGTPGDIAGRFHTRCTAMLFPD